jgi:hypothetical protein
LAKFVKRTLFVRAKGVCECTMRGCLHHDPGVQCGYELIPGEWEAHRKVAGGFYVLSNLTAMCAECHKNTRSYGRG